MTTRESSPSLSYSCATTRYLMPRFNKLKRATPNRSRKMTQLHNMWSNYRRKLPSKHILQQLFCVVFLIHYCMEKNLVKLSMYKILIKTLDHSGPCDTSAWCDTAALVPVHYQPSSPARAARVTVLVCLSSLRHVCTNLSENFRLQSYGYVLVGRIFTPP